jgi:purine catabolism regulator
MLEYHQVEDDSNIDKCTPSFDLLVSQLLHPTQDDYLDASSFVSIGSIAESLHDIKRCYEDAKKAKELGRALWRNQKVYFYSNLAHYSLLDQSMLENIDLSELTYLTKQNQLVFDTIETMETYLEIRNYKQTAAKLHIHENTLRHRIQKISELLHLDLNNPLVCFSFLQKIKLWRLKKTLY